MPSRRRACRSRGRTTRPQGESGQGSTKVSFEVEIKFRTDAAGHAELVRQLTQLGAESSPHASRGHLSESSARDFAETGEALRLRREGDAELGDLQGARQAGSHEDPRGIELTSLLGRCASADGAHLGASRFRPVAILHKRRQAYRLLRAPRHCRGARPGRGLGAFRRGRDDRTAAADLPAARPPSSTWPRRWADRGRAPVLPPDGTGAGTRSRAGRGEEKDPSGPRNLAGQT